jgi:hypothetical protein
MNDDVMNYVYLVLSPSNGIVRWTGGKLIWAWSGEFVFEARESGELQIIEVEDRSGMIAVGDMIS